MGSQSYTTPGIHTFTVPANVKSLIVKCWGGGGAGGGANAPGGGSGAAGGAYAQKTVTVTPLTEHTIIVADITSGTLDTGAKGGSSSFDTNVVLAIGGDGGGKDAGSPGVGSTTGCVGDILYAGGTGIRGTSTYGGGAGGGAGTNGAGGDAANRLGGGGSPTGGGIGGNGTASALPGNSGNQAGGGGGAGFYEIAADSGFTGAAGRVDIEWTDVTNTGAFFSDYF